MIAAEKRSRSAVVFPAAVIGVVAMMVVPLPSLILDLLLSVNIAAGVLILLASMNATRVLDLASFPSILLLATLFRLGLNVSTTRQILGTGSAGSVITSFGQSVVGGSLVVGLVIFFILVIIQFVVITNGSSRVSEVAARFTLDAMPGKQMAIDADLNAGLISDGEARRRRNEIAQEADFFGAMEREHCASSHARLHGARRAAPVAFGIPGRVRVDVSPAHLPQADRRRGDLRRRRRPHHGARSGRLHVSPGSKIYHVCYL